MVEQTAAVTLVLNDDMSRGLDSLSKQLDAISGKLQRAGSDAAAHGHGLRGLLEQFERVSKSHREQGGRVGEVFEFLRSKVEGAGKGLEGIIKNLNVVKTGFVGTTASAEGMAMALGRVTGAVGAIGFALYKGGEQLQGWANHFAEMHVKMSLFREGLGATNDRAIDTWRRLGASLGKTSDESDAALSRVVGLLDDARKGYDSNLAHIAERHPGMMREFDKWFDEIARQGKAPIEVVTEFMDWAAKQTPEFRRQLSQETGLQFDFLSNRAIEVRREMRPVWEPPDEAFKKLEEKKEELTKLNEEWKQAWADWAKWAQFNIESLVIPALVKAIEWVNKAIETFKKIGTQVPPERRTRRGPIGPILLPALRDLMQPQKFTEGNELREVNTSEKEGNIYLREIRDVMEWLKAQIEGKGGAGGGGVAAAAGGGGAGAQATWNGPGTGPTASAGPSTTNSPVPSTQGPSTTSSPAPSTRGPSTTSSPAPSTQGPSTTSSPVDQGPARSTAQGGGFGFFDKTAAGATTAGAAGIAPHFPVAGNVNWKNLDAEYISRMNKAYDAMPDSEKRDFRMISGYRPATREEARKLGMSESSSQEDIWERSGHGTRFAAAPPGLSRHQLGQAGDYTKTDWLRAHQGEYGLETLTRRGAVYDYPHVQMNRNDTRRFLEERAKAQRESQDTSRIDKSLAAQGRDSSRMTQTKLAINVSGAPRGTRINAKGDGVFANVALHRSNLGPVSVALESQRRHTTELG